LPDLGARWALPQLRHCVSAGEPLNPEVIERWRDAFGLTIYDGYGQTENTLLVANVPGRAVRPGSMGVPTPGHHVAVVDADGNVCAPGEVGDIGLRGRPPSLFTEYYKNPEETRASMRGAWYLTGDRAQVDDDGYFWFVGRADDVISSGAYRIGPFEVESALLEHPAVLESAVVGSPDADRGNIVKAFVVLRAGYTGDDALVRELQEHCKRVTAPYKYPRLIAFVDELPKTRSGKIRRVELRQAELRAKGATAASGFV
jgi:acyl-coenzyme A synthetase/AMP-(fatty) acid ligase